MKTCTRCLYDESIEGITFDENGVCNYCHLHDRLEREYPKDRQWLKKNAAQFYAEGKPFDVIVGFSGGCDSSFLLWETVRAGLRPLAVQVDNFWNEPIAYENMKKVTDGLHVPLEVVYPPRREFHEAYRAFFFSGTTDTEAVADLSFKAALYDVAEKYGCKTIFIGHSFRTEGISPLGWLYFDDRYMRDVAAKYGRRCTFKLLPRLTLWNQFRWGVLKRIRTVKPLWYIDHDKEETKKALEREFGCKWYGGHHLENMLTAFYHSYWMPKRRGIDQRRNGLSALVRSGQISRDCALAELAVPPEVDEGWIDRICEGFDIKRDEWPRIEDGPVKSYRQYKTYKELFHRLRWFIAPLALAGLASKSFYEKYCKGI